MYAGSKEKRTRTTKKQPTQNEETHSKDNAQNRGVDIVSILTAFRVSHKGSTCYHGLRGKGSTERQKTLIVSMRQSAH
jgi:hypothetical protein